MIDKPTATHIFTLVCAGICEEDKFAMTGTVKTYTLLFSTVHLVSKSKFRVQQTFDQAKPATPH